MKTVMLGLMASVLLGCSGQSSTNPASERVNSDSSMQSNEKHRPNVHFTPPANWMNDPNGMVYYAGEYHLFYQYHPGSTIWGPMHWGHAVSKDMLNWQHLPVALYPDELGTIFSGSVVVDWENTSGLGTKDNPPMVALFTYHDVAGEQAGTLDFQTQGLAYSLDKGRTWTKYSQNPVMKNPGLKDYRDPKVSWYAPQKKWIMALAQGDNIGFHSSKNLIDWQAESTFGEKIGAHGGVWECPDLLEMTIASTGETKHVLLVSLVPGAPNGGSGTQYFVGDFDGSKFTVDPEFSERLEQKEAIWLDYGTDNYAGVTFSNVPDTDGRTLFMGWMNNWLYARDVPTEAWRGSMTTPRNLVLQETAQGPLLFSQPITELHNISHQVAQLNNVEVSSDTDLSALLGPIEESHRVTMKVKRQGANTLSLDYKNNDDLLSIRLDVNAGTVTIDRAKSGETEFEEHFANQQVGVIRAGLDTYSFDIIYDKASIELFVNDGELSMTALAFPSTPYNEITFSADGQALIEHISLDNLTAQQAK